MEIKTDEFANIQEVTILAYGRKVVAHIAPDGMVCLYLDNQAVSTAKPRTLVG